jgi:hypothetical protein
VIRTQASTAHCSGIGRTRVSGRRSGLIGHLR